MKKKYRIKRVDYSLIPEFIGYPSSILNNMIQVGILFNDSELVDDRTKERSAVVINRMIL